MYEIALFFSVLCFVAVAFAFVRSAAFSVFHPLTFYLAFHGFIFVVRPIVAHVAGFDLIYRFYQFTPSLSDKVTALFVSTLGMLVFAAACWRSGSEALRFPHRGSLDTDRSKLWPTFLLVLLICVPIGLYSLNRGWTTALATGSAYSNMVQAGRGGITINTESNGYFMDAQLILVPCVAIFAWIFRFNIIAIIPLVIFVIFRAGTGGRGPAIAALVCTALLYFYDRRRRWPSLKVLMIVPVLAMTFTAVGDDRGAAIRRALSTDTSSEIFSNSRADERILEGMDFANLEYLEYVIYVVPQRSGTYSYFNDLLQVFTEPIPRVLWKEKPIGAPFQRINLMAYGYPVGMTLSLPGEGWMSLGWAGVVLWCGLCGWVLGTIYRRFAIGQQNVFTMLAYMVFLSTLIVSFRDGQLITVLKQCLFYLFPVGMWWALSRVLGIPSIGTFPVSQRPSRHEEPKEESARGMVNYDEQLPPAVLRRRKLLAQDES